MSKSKGEERLERMTEIADEGDKRQQDEFREVEDESKPAAPGGPVVAPEEESTPAVHATQESEPRKLKIKVNGEDRELTEAELIAAAQKNLAADANLQSSAEALRLSAEQALSNKPEVPNEEDIALARALQMGSEEDAVKAIRKLREPLSKTPDVAHQVDERMTVLKERDRFEGEFKDLLENDLTRDMIFARDAQLAQANPQLPYMARWRQAAKDVQSISAMNHSRADVLERKRTSTSIPSAAARAVVNEEDEIEESPSAVIEAIAKARHQSLR